jgi:hypothetical protein
MGSFFRHPASYRSAHGSAGTGDKYHFVAHPHRQPRMVFF